MKKKIVYVDMDNTIVDFKSGIEKLSKEDQEKFKDNFDDHPEIFALMEPIDGAIKTLKELNKYFDLYILSTAPWDNPNAWKQKRDWIEKYFGKGEENIFYKKVILSHHKDLNDGDILIDDRPNNGAENFKGSWIHFATDDFPDWDSVFQKLISEASL
jgi:5'(3')-deoxyribonucleotidase